MKYEWQKSWECPRINEVWGGLPCLRLLKTGDPDTEKIIEKLTQLDGTRIRKIRNEVAAGGAGLVT